MWALLHSILNIEGCQEDENIGLDEAIKDIKIETENRRDSDRNHHLDELHDDKRTEHITKQSHAERQRPDENLQNIDRGYDRNRLGKALEPALRALLVNAGVFDQ